MYCSNCGNKIVDGNTFCTNCGIKLVNVNVNDVLVKKEDSGLKIASIVLGSLGICGSLTFIFSPISLILCLIGLILGIIATKKVRNIVGIVLNSVGLFLSLIMVILMILVFGYLFDVTDGYEDDYNHNNYYHDYLEKF